jgi:MFS family permease
VLAVFFGNGAVFGNWVVRIPEFQARFQLNEGALGLVLMCGAAGTMAALAVTSGLIARFGSRAMTVAGGTLLSLALAILPFIPNTVALAAAIFVLGAAMSLMDVSMNTQASEVERRYARPLMSSFHAAWSLGGFAGAAIGAGLMSLSVPGSLHFLGVAVAFSGLVELVRRGLLVSRGDPSEQREPVFQRPPPGIRTLGVLALCAGVAEGAMGDWSAVYLEKIVHAPADVAALGFTAFSIAMAAGRLLGDALALSIGSRCLVRAGGILAAVGLAMAALVPEVPVVITGFLAVGLGLANAIPVSFSAAGNVPGIPPGKGIAGVATIGYAGFLIGPPGIGLLAEATSLRVSLGYVAGLALCIAVVGRAVRGKSPTVERDGSAVRDAA